MTVTPSKINGHDALRSAEQRALEAHRYMQDVLSALFEIHGGDLFGVLATLNATELGVLSMLHNGNHEMVARHIENAWPILAENMRAMVDAAPLRTVH